MTVRELRDWVRFENRHQPLPDRMFDVHHAVLDSLVVNLVRSADAPPVAAADFFVARQPAQPPPDDGLTEVERQMRAWRGGG